MTHLYFVILLGSCLLFCAAYWRTPGYLLLAAAFLAMLYLVLPMVAYNGQLRSILALRAMPVLSMVACLHCLLFIAESLRGRVSAFRFGLVVLQVLLITFTMHLRTTTSWQVVTIVGFGVAVLLAARFRLFGVTVASWRSAGLGVGAAVGLVVAGYVGLQVYQAVVLPEEYRRGDEIGTRVFWHNIFSGLAYHPAFAERYRLRIDDNSVFTAAGEFLAERGRAAEWQAMGGESFEFMDLKFAPYDPVVREMLVARCSVHPRECLEAMLVYKPAALVGNVAWLYGLQELPPNLQIVVPWKLGEPSAQVKHQYIDATRRMDEHGERAYLWTPLALVVIVPFALVLVVLPGARRSVGPAAAAGVALVLGSTIPSVIGYPLPHTILEPAIAVGIVAYLGLCVAIYFALCATAAWLPALLANLRLRPHVAEAPSPSPSLSTAAQP